MNKVRLPRPELEGLSPYDTKDVRADIILSANECPRNLPSEILEKLTDYVRRDIQFNRYPDPMCTRLRTIIAEANGLDPCNVLVGNGGDEIIMDVILAWGGPGRTLVNLPPTFSMYAQDAHICGTTVVDVPRHIDFSIDEDALLAAIRIHDPDIIVFTSPNNPTGTMTPETLLLEVLHETDALVLVDEAYFEFSRQTMRPYMARHSNLAILRTFSKAFALAGLRAGYLFAHPDVISELTKVRQPYSVNSFTQAAASLAFRERMIFEEGISETLRNRDRIMQGLSDLPGVEVFPSEANFVLFRVEQAPAVWRDLLHGHSILIRDCSGTPGLRDCLRVTVGTAEECEAFLAAMDEILTSKRAAQVFGMNAVAARHMREGG